MVVRSRDIECLPTALAPSGVVLTLFSMNENHTQLCPSPEWAAYIQDEVLPALTAIASLGEELLELGPGPGAATEWLRHRVRRLDRRGVGRSGRRPAGPAVRRDQRRGRARRRHRPAVPLGRRSTRSACFTMLHHVATPSSSSALDRRGVPGAPPRRGAPRLGQPREQRPAPLPRGRHLQPDRAGRRCSSASSRSASAGSPSRSTATSSSWPTSPTRRSTSAARESTRAAHE